MECKWTKKEKRKKNRGKMPVDCKETRKWKGNMRK